MTARAVCPAESVRIHTSEAVPRLSCNAVKRHALGCLLRPPIANSGVAKPENNDTKARDQPLNFPRCFLYTQAMANWTSRSLQELNCEAVQYLDL